MTDSIHITNLSAVLPWLQSKLWRRRDMQNTPVKSTKDLISEARDQLTAVGDLVNLLFLAGEGLTAEFANAITRGCDVVSREIDKTKTLLDAASDQARGAGEAK